MASLTRWTWVWVDSGSWWWTGKPGMLRFMGWQRVELNLVELSHWTELNWMEPKLGYFFSLFHFIYYFEHVFTFYQLLKWVRTCPMDLFWSVLFQSTPTPSVISFTSMPFYIIYILMIHKIISFWHSHWNKDLYNKLLT